MGTLKYFIGSNPYLQVKIISKLLSLSEASTKQHISLLWKFIFSPDICSNKHKMTFRFLAYSRSSSRRRMVSPAYCRIDTHPSIISVVSLVNKPVSCALFIKIANISTSTSTSKRREERAPPASNLDVLRNIIQFLH
jgi:hypothetical protein